MVLGLWGATDIRDGSKITACVHGTHCVRPSYAMIPSLVPQHKGQSGLLALAAEVPRVVQAESCFKVLLRKKKH